MTRSRTTSSTRGHAGLPAERAFVVQLRADADLTRGIIRGRIEHVLSGAAQPFDSLEELLACMRDVVVRQAATSRRDHPAKCESD